MLEKNTLVRKKALERLYDGVCTIYDMVEVVDPDDGSTSFTESTVAENVPCRVCIGSSPIAVQGNDRATVNQTITLYCDPDVAIKKGSKIVTTQYGVTVNYKSAGVPAVYDVFQSVQMELEENGC